MSTQFFSYCCWKIKTLLLKLLNQFGFPKKRTWSSTFFLREKYSSKHIDPLGLAWPGLAWPVMITIFVHVVRPSDPKLQNQATITASGIVGWPSGSLLTPFLVKFKFCTVWWAHEYNFTHFNFLTYSYFIRTALKGAKEILRWAEVKLQKTFHNLGNLEKVYEESLQRLKTCFCHNRLQGNLSYQAPILSFSVLCGNGILFCSRKFCIDENIATFVM